MIVDDLLVNNEENNVNARLESDPVHTAQMVPPRSHNGSRTKGLEAEMVAGRGPRKERAVRGQANRVRFDDNGIEIDAAIVGEGLGMDPLQVIEQLRTGSVTTRCEKGIDEDHGRHRLTFLTRSRRLQLIVDDAGNVLQRGVINFGDPPLPPKLRISSS